MLEDEETAPVIRVGGLHPEAIELRFSELLRPFAQDDPADPFRDFLVIAHNQSVRVQLSVRTMGGDGLVAFLTELAEDFRGWNDARTWRSMERELTLSAEHLGSRVQLTWGLHDRIVDDQWHFTAITEHAPGEDMRKLAADVHRFLEL
ncbi:DUF6228 family protein [Labedaea rhizosphaerae]|uniref:DUF6228 family protein n=1 Tax=Labedaea rhizosphaerae TaxID=598644 RepID=UPI00105F0C6D|nr:DUF6228 family protein [Labedaea rhizosphaerae]